jgi:hypothetical protein
VAAADARRQLACIGAGPEKSGAYSERFVDDVNDLVESSHHTSAKTQMRRTARALSAASPVICY